MSKPDHVLDRRRGPEDIGHLRYRDDLRAIAQRALERLERERAVVGDVDPTQERPLALAMEMPGHDVGVMLHHAQHDLVACPDAPKTKAGRYEIDRLRGRASEDDLVVRSGVDEPPRCFPGRLIGLCRRIGEVVQSAMHIGVFVLVGISEPVDNLLRLLRRCRVIQIDKRLAIGALGKNWKLRAYRLYVVSVERGLDEIVHAFASAVRRRPRGQVRSLVSVSRIVRIRASRSRPEPRAQPGAQGVDQEFVPDAVDGLSPNASSSIALASRSGMPRDRK